MAKRGADMTEQAQDTGPQYEFTNDWFSQTASLPVWRQLISQNKPRRILEIGSFEGRSTSWMIENCAPRSESGLSIVCIDSWEGGVEHKAGGGQHPGDIARQHRLPGCGRALRCGECRDAEDHQRDQGRDGLGLAVGLACGGGQCAIRFGHGARL